MAVTSPWSRSAFIHGRFPHVLIDSENGLGVLPLQGPSRLAQAHPMVKFAPPARSGFAIEP